MKSESSLFHKNCKKLPPYARSLFERQKFTNLPLLVVVCIGQNCWNRAKSWNKSPNDITGLVLPPDEKPERYSWPVTHCDCVVEWAIGPSESQIINLVEILLRSGASSVTVLPLFVDFDSDLWEFNPESSIGDRWTQTRETIRTYYPSQVITNAA